MGIIVSQMGWFNHQLDEFIHLGLHYIWGSTASDSYPFFLTIFFGVLIGPFTTPKNPCMVYLPTFWLIFISFHVGTSPMDPMGTGFWGPHNPMTASSVP